MKVKIKSLQAGGAAPAPDAGAPAPAPEGAPVGGGQPNPEEQLAQMAMQIIQQLGPEAAAMLAQMIMQVLQQGAAPQGEPVYAKKGGKLTLVARR